MAITFLKQQKIQKSLIFIFTAVILITIIVIWQGFFKKETEVLPEEIFLPLRKEIKINFEIFKNPVLEKLQPFTEIEPFKETISVEGEIEEKLGRENPFLPY